MRPSSATLKNRPVETATAAAHRCCPVCGADNRDRNPLTESREPWRLKQCGECQFVYLENAPLYAELTETFAWEKTCAAERHARRQREPVIAALSSARKRLAGWLLKRRKGGKLYQLIHEYVDGGRILDVGCGGGLLIQNLERRFTPFGIEISQQLACESQKVFGTRGGNVVHEPALSGLGQFADNFFDGVLMRAYLEHEREPAAVLAETWRVLKPAGCVLIKVPNYGCWNRPVRGSRWCGYRFPDHVNYFTPRSLRRVLEDNAFVVARCGWFDRLPTNDNMWLVARKAGHLPARYRQAG